MTPVSSPTMHSAIRIWRSWEPLGRALCSTRFELTTFTTSVCPVVPGCSSSTFTNTGFFKFVFTVAVAMPITINPGSYPLFSSRIRLLPAPSSLLQTWKNCSSVRGIIPTTQRKCIIPSTQRKTETHRQRQIITKHTNLRNARRSFKPLGRWVAIVK